MKRSIFKSVNVVNLNRMLDKIRTICYDKLVDTDGYVTPDKIKNALYGTEEKSKTNMI